MGGGGVWIGETDGWKVDVVCSVVSKNVIPPGLCKEQEGTHLLCSVPALSFVGRSGECHVINHESHVGISAYNGSVGYVCHHIEGDNCSFIPL